LVFGHRFEALHSIGHLFFTIFAFGSSVIEKQRHDVRSAIAGKRD
jgi:hypothetical protein